MSSELLQFLLSGITVGAIYALVGLGFSIIYTASHVINFAQGEFVMIGGMGTVFIASAGVPLPIAMAGAVLLAVVIGISLQKLAIERARHASHAECCSVRLFLASRCLSARRVCFADHAG